MSDHATRASSPPGERPSESLRYPIEWMNDLVAVFRDDDRDGWKLTLTRSNDGDFWIGMAPDVRDREDGDLDGLVCGGIRVRAPMHGGGSHEALYQSLADLWARITHPASEASEPTRDLVGHPRVDGDPRDEIELFIRDAYAAGANAAHSRSLVTAMEYAAREAPRLRECLAARSLPEPGRGTATDGQI